jgi:hypothetical protein
VPASLARSFLAPAFGRLFGRRFGRLFGRAFLRSFGRRRLGHTVLELGIFLELGEIGDHRLEIVRLPAALLVALVFVRHIAVLERQQRPVLGLLQHDGNDRIVFLVAEFAGAPRLDDAFAVDQFKIAAADIAVPCRDLGADFIRHRRLAAGHLGMADTVKPGLVDFLRPGRDRRGQCECVRHAGLPRTRAPVTTERVATDRASVDIASS